MRPAIVALMLILPSCGGNNGSQPPTPSPPAATIGSCSIPLAPPALTATSASATKSSLPDDRRARRGRVYEELWKHQAEVGRRRLAPASFKPTATTEDIGQISVVRDEGDLILPA